MCSYSFSSPNHISKKKTTRNRYKPTQHTVLSSGTKPQQTPEPPPPDRTVGTKGQR